MKFIKTMIGASLVLATFSSCRKEEALNLENTPGLGGDTWVNGPIDKWINDTLTTPYNIAVKYKWDQSEVFLDRTIVPAKEEVVIPVLSAINKVWVRSYIAEAGLLFFKNYSPKFFTLAGSPAYNPNGSFVQGLAEGGRKVTLLDLNRFRVKGMPGYVASDTAFVLRMFHVIHHEFAHILDQNIRVPISFSSPSANSYTSDWTNVTELEGKNEGFITSGGGAYSISNKDDDFAEMVCTMLVYGRPYFDNFVNSINYTGTTPNGTTAVQARNRLRQKEASVVSYFKQAWNIDFYSLQARTRAEINALLY